MLFNQRIEKYITKMYESKEEKTGFFKWDMERQGVLNSFKKEWLDIMTNLGLYNKYYDAYTPNNIEITEYGIKCDIYITTGLNFEKLDNCKNTIQENLNCTLILNSHKSSCFIDAKFIFCPKEDKEFKIVKQDESYKVYIGNDYSGNPIFLDLKDFPHVMISGGTRSGKSKMTDVMIVNSAVNIPPSDLELFFFQVAKSDLVLYEDLIHTRAFCDTLDKCEIGLNYIVNKVMVERDKLIKPYRKKAMADNYHDYNKLGKGKKMPTIMCVFDETSSIFNAKGDDGSVKKQKQAINALMEKVAQYGASLGVFLATSLQRPTMENMSPFIKSQSISIVSFKQNNNKSAEVATDDAELPIGLKQRQFVFKQDNWDYGIVPWINNTVVYEAIKPFLKPGHKTIFDELGSTTLSKEDIQEMKKSRAKVDFEDPKEKETGIAVVDNVIKTIKKGKVKEK
jgi:S-DNA-T family DNA segregation ATPase FtsK/SpoIIIE